MLKKPALDVSEKRALSLNSLCKVKSTCRCAEAAQGITSEVALAAGGNGETGFVDDLASGRCRVGEMEGHTGHDIRPITE